MINNKGIIEHIAIANYQLYSIEYILCSCLED